MKEYRCKKKCAYDTVCTFQNWQIEEYLNNERPLCLGGEDITLEDLEEIEEK